MLYVCCSAQRFNFELRAGDVSQAGVIALAA